MMSAVLLLLVAQGLLGALDNLWHHEFTEKLPGDPAARTEIALHSIRELLYGLIFLSIAWVSWDGTWTYVLLVILAVEILITLIDFIVEDRTRKLPPFERVLHTILALNYGAVLALWAPALIDWAARPTGFGVVDYGWLSWTLTLYGVGVLAWGFRDLRAVWRWMVPDWQRSPLHAGPNPHPRHILVTGGTGFVGRSLVRALIAGGEQITVLTRNPARAEFHFGPHVTTLQCLDTISTRARIDAIVNLAGAPILGGLWSRRRKRLLVASRVETTERLEALCARLTHKPRVLINASAVGYYGDRGDLELTEAAGPAPGFLSELCQKWEAKALAFEALGMRVCLMRFGIVLDPSGGMLAPMKIAGTFGLITVLGRGEQWMPWVTRHDLVRMIRFALDRPDLSGSVNAVSPNPITNRQFVQKLAGALRRPVMLRMPAWPLKAMLGEMSDLMLVSQRAIPQRLLALGFQFKHASIDNAFDTWFGRPRVAAPAGPVRVLFNDECPVCAREMDVYARDAVASGAQLEFCPLSEHAEELSDYGLDQADAERRLYVIDANGRALGGFTAFLPIWVVLPRFRWLARLFAHPAAAVVGAVIYDVVMVPALATFNGQRKRFAAAQRKEPPR